MIKQLLAIFFIYVCTSAAWAILGGTVLARTDSLGLSNYSQVGQLWGSEQNQQTPSFYYETQKQVKQTSIKDNKTVTETVTEVEKHNLPLDRSTINANIVLDHRQKGLMWYSTYKVNFGSDYAITNNTDAIQHVHMDFPLPADQANYDNFRLKVGDELVKNTVPANGVVSTIVPLKAGESKTFDVAYDSQGLTSWHYSFGSNVNQVRNFSLNLKTNFDDIDFPNGSMSPSQKTKLGKGWQLTWDYKNLLTGYNIGLKMPEKLNPGPWVSKVTFFAPVSLFLFYFVLFTLTMIKGIRVHPMNYFFIGSAFFSFHLLLAYLVDHISVNLAFAISSTVSVILVVSYMRLVVSPKFAFFEVGLSQLVYLVLFSYTFFFEQYTGLVITIMCVLTLFVMMQFTGRIDWFETFRKASAGNNKKLIEEQTQSA